MPGSELDTGKVKMRKTWSLGRIPRRREAGGREGLFFLCPKPFLGGPPIALRIKLRFYTVAQGEPHLGGLIWSPLPPL